MADEPENVAEESDADDDELVEEFAREWSNVKAKLAAIPDDIGEKLDALLAGQSSGGRGSGAASEPRTAPRVGAQPKRTVASPTTRAPSRQSDQPSDSGREKKPKDQHWYYRSRKRDE